MCIVLCSSPSLCPAFLWQRRNCFIDHLLEPLGSELFFFLYNYYFFVLSWMWKIIFLIVLFFSFLCYLCVCRRKTNYKSQPFFVHMLVNWLKYLSLLLGIGVDRGRWEEKKDEEKALHFSFFIRWSGCLQGYSCNIYKCCLHHWTTKKK